MTKIRRLLFKSTFAAVLTFSVFPIAAQIAPATQAAPNPGQKATSSVPTPQEISDAKAKGMVWVNTSTHVYHKDGAFYGATKHGKFMTEDDAMKAGYRAAKTPGSKKAVSPAPPAK